MFSFAQKEKKRKKKKRKKMSVDQKKKMAVACKNGRVGEVQRLLKEAPSLVNACPNESGWTPLHHASSCGHTEIVTILLASNADPNTKNQYDWTPLHKASLNGNTEIVELLLASNANPNTEDQYHNTPLYSATENGHTEVVKLLLASNADPNTKANYDWTPLHKASLNGDTEIVELLLASNADPNIEDVNDDTPLRKACINGHTEIVKLLLASNADPNLKDKDGVVVLHEASSKGYTEIVKLLLASNADLNALNNFNDTPLHRATFCGYPDVVQILLAANADPDLKNDNGDKPGAAFGSDVDAATQQEIRQLVRKRRIEPQQENSSEDFGSKILLFGPTSSYSSTFGSTSSLSSPSPASSHQIQEAERIGTIKCKFGEDAVRFSLKNTTTLEELNTMVKAEWGEGKGLKFQDRDGDWLKIRNNDEVVEVWNQTKAGVVTLKVFTQQNQSSPLPQLSAPEEMAFENSEKPPPPHCFQTAPELNFEDSLKALLQGPKERPPGRNDLEIANDDLLEALLYYCEETYEQKMREHPDLVGLLEKEQALAIIAYTCEYPYKVYFWLNAWLMQNRRDQEVINNVGPFFRLFYQGLEKLPRTTLKAGRAVTVENIPQFRKLFQNPPNKGVKYTFWGVTSFLLKDEIVGEFSGKGEEDAILFSCGDLECVSIEKLSAEEREAEVIPLPPAIFQVSTTITVNETKLVIALDHKPKDHVRCSYLQPASPNK